VRCPHCLTSFHSHPKSYDLDSDANSYWRVAWEPCPACSRFVIFLAQYPKPTPGYGPSGPPSDVSIVYPKAVARKPFPPGVVPAKITEDYKEACLVLADSPKASAALSRRCLQNILRDHAKVKHQDLSKEIDEVLASKQLPSHLANDIDAVRNYGNFAAHPIKSTKTGEIVDVEPGEAEWNLDVLEGLFDFYFVGPAESKKKREALEKKLADAGKPSLKKPAQ
jgi:hypothetical protein